MSDSVPTETPRHRRRHARYGMGVTVVVRDEFLTRDEAAARLGKVSVGWLQFSDILEGAVLDDGTEGVTLRSVEREFVWQAQAT